ncbi:tetratricopeptide repeat protein [Rhodohalobacter halophilus]|uniref:tetratricopeptide repeat protein n=1 Tax=Rhodohalobacter halophilus TaxID=1812810 RepID=UPI000A079837|nr:tetratricopeptide repeat protein [Rhodohalobacter halophilus]
MKILKPLLLIFLLAGFMWGCETTDPLVNDVQVQLLTGNFDEALQIVDSAIAEDDNNYIAHYYKGYVLSAQAETLEDPRDRKEYYERARVSYDRAKEIMSSLEEQPDEYQELEDTVTSFWADEFNAGVNILNDDSLNAATPDPNYTAIAHFENAATIQPDSALTYQVMSSAYFNEQDMENAVSSYEKAMELLGTPEADDYEYMVGILLVNEDYAKAIRYAEEARSVYPDESIFIQLLADAYLQSGDRDQAIELVEGLIADDPENPQYRRVLGTQIYQLVNELNDEVSSHYDEMFDLRQEARNASGSELQRIEDRIEELESLIERKQQDSDEMVQIAIREMEKVVELEPDDESANFILGIIYQNRAASYFERRNNTDDNEESQMFDDMARQDLEQSLVYYERAAELNPENPENWQSLFQVYTILGMEEKAEEAMEKAGM